MTRRNILVSFLCTATIAAAGFAVHTPAAFGQPTDKHSMAAMTGGQRDHCIKMSAACAAACDKVGSDDMKACAKAYRDCAAACRAMGK